MKAVFVIFAACSLLVAAGDFDYWEDEAFLQWVGAYLEEGSSDLKEIYPQWKKNAEFVDMHNSLGLSYSLSMNQFGHLSEKDLPKTPFSQLLPLSHKEDHLSFDSLPSSVDWRNKGVIFPVQNQGQCGSAYALAVVRSIDAFWAIKHGKLVAASEQQYEDCCLTKDPDSGCKGGILGVGSFDCVAKIGGLAAGEEYRSPNGLCNTSFPVAVKISGGIAVCPSGNEEALAAAVVIGPVVAGIDAGHTSFQLYRSGVYQEPSCSTKKLDHAVLVIGYGSMNGMDYWILQNSWGPSWGMNGYMLLARNKSNMCGVATNASYPY